jgi:hypothetical protein
VAYIRLLFKYAFICIPNTGRHIRTVNYIDGGNQNTSENYIKFYQVHYISEDGVKSQTI